MAFRNATTIKIISDAVTPDVVTTLTGSVGTSIDAAVAAAAAITAVRTEKVNVDLNAVINGKESPIEIVQSGVNIFRHAQQLSQVSGLVRA